jgi:hypothetical protein
LIYSRHHRPKATIIIMSARAPSTKAILQAFTEPITPIIGRPDHADIRRFLRELKINARSVWCDIGGGQHGYVWMLEDTPTWLARAGITTTATPPTNPGACSATGTAAEREAARWLWEEAKYMAILRQHGSSLPKTNQGQYRQ